MSTETDPLKKSIEGLHQGEWDLHGRINTLMDRITRLEKTRENQFITDFSVIKLGPNEVLVIRVPEDMLPEVIVHMRAAVAEMVGTDRVIVVSDNIAFEVIKAEKVEATLAMPCEHCGGSNRDEGGKPCEFCPPWMPRKFA